MMMTFLVLNKWHLFCNGMELYSTYTNSNAYHGHTDMISKPNVH